MARASALVVVLALVTFFTALSSADGGPRDVRDGMTLRTAHPPDRAGARAAFERAASSGEAATASTGLYFLGEMDEEDMRFAEAAATYDASIARLPSGRYAQRAATRFGALTSHAEGDYGPLVRLERVRRDPRLSSDPDALGSLAKDADGFPAGPVRSEARLLVAEAYGTRLHRPGDAIALWWLVAEDPRADVLASREAAVAIVNAEIARGNLDGAREARAKLMGKLDVQHVALVTRVLRLRTVHALSIAQLLLTALAFVVALTRGDARSALGGGFRVLPMAIAFSVFAAGVGGFLASSYETGSATPFWMMAPVMVAAIGVGGAWRAVGSDRPGARILRGVMCATSIFAAAVLLLERMTPEYLEGFGL